MDPVRREDDNPTMAQPEQMESLSNLTIICCDRYWTIPSNSVNKVAPQMMAYAVSDPAAEHPYMISHHDVNPATMDHLCQYICSNNYDVSMIKDATGQKASIVTPVNDQLIMHARVFGLAEHYEITELMGLATMKFSRTSEQRWSTDGFALVVAEVNNCSGKASRWLREALMCAAGPHISELVDNTSFMRDLAEREGLQDFAAHMFKQMAKKCATLNGEIAKLNDDKKGESRVIHVMTMAAVGAPGRARDALQRLMYAVESLPGICDGCGATTFRQRKVVIDDRTVWLGQQYGGWIECVLCQRHVKYF